MAERTARFCPCGADITHRHGNAKFCRSCYTQRERDLDVERGPWYDRCAQCGEGMPSSRGRYCSRECRRVGSQAKRVPQTKECRGCGEMFVSRSNRGRFCSNPCLQLFHRYGAAPKRTGRVCITCGGALPAAALIGTKYCGEDCRPVTRPDGRPPTLPRVFRQRVAACAYCKTQFETTQTKRRYCSQRCSDYGWKADEAHRAYERRFGRTCKRCGEEIPSSRRIGSQFCCVSCQCCFNQELRRARKRGLPVEKISRFEIFERDNYTCHICWEPIHDKPVLDHLIPLAVKGCPGHVKENVAAAHAFCNSSKNARVRPEDYRLYVELSLGGSISA